MARRLTVFTSLALLSFACGGNDLEEPEPKRLDQPIPARLRVFAQHENLVADVPVQPSYVGYRGDADVWRTLLAVDGEVTFDIEHERYALWIVCPGPDGPTGTVRAFYLHAEDSSELVARCNIDVFATDLPNLTVEFGDTPENGAVAVSVALDEIHTLPISATGGTVGVTAYSDADGGEYDLATTLRPQSGARSLRIERDTQIVSTRTLTLDFGREYVPVQLAQITSPDDRQIDTFYVTGRGTRVLIERSTTGTVAMAPTEVRDDGDVHLVVTTRQDGYHMSYREDPTTAVLNTIVGPSGPSEPRLEVGAERALRATEIALADTQFFVQLAGTTRAVIEWATTPGYLNGATELTIEPPADFDPAWRFGDVNDPYDTSATYFESDVATSVLLEEELFESVAATPRSRAGRDLTVSFSGRSGLLRQSD